MSHNEISINLDSLLINRINKTDNCYCCREETTSVSPCVCKTAMCDSCLFTYVKYNDKCTICNTQLQIYIPSPTSTRGTLSPMSIMTNTSLSYSLSFEDDTPKFDFMFILKVLLFLLCIFYSLCLIHYVGIIGNHFLIRTPLVIHFRSYEILMGFVYLVGSFMAIIIITLSLCIISIIFQLIYDIIFCKCLTN